MTSPKRPLQHELESKSLAIFENVIPRNWVFRRKDNDYGVDGEIEIFESNATTGRMFNVQLKSTDIGSAAKNHQRINIKKETLNYYKQITLPVLIVKVVVDFESENHKVYADWAVNFDETKNGALNCTIDVKCLLNLSRFKQIEEDIKYFGRLKNDIITRPIPYYIDFSKTCKIRHNTRLKIEEGIIGRLDEKDKHHFKVDRIDKAFIRILLDHKVIKVFFKGICFFKGPHHEDFFQKPNELASLIKSFIIAAFNNAGAKRLALSLLLDDKQILSQVDFEWALTIFTGSEIPTSEFIECMNHILNNVESEDFRNSLKTIFLSMNRAVPSAAKEHFEDIIRTTNDNDQKAVMHYNLGMVYRSQNEFKLAVSNFVKAKNCLPDYLNRSYFNEHVADCLFELKKFKAAANFYDRAIKINDETFKPITKLLLADALMFAGQYREAYKIFDAEIEADPTVDSEWTLKRLALDIIIENLKLESQKRIAPPHKGIERDVKVLQSFLSEYDALDSLSWFNLGVSMESEKDEKSVNMLLICSFMTGLLNRYDPEAWGKFILLSLTSDNMFWPFLHHIIRHAFDVNENEILSFCYQAIDQQLAISESKKEKLKETLKNLRDEDFTIKMDKASLN